MAPAPNLAFVAALNLRWLVTSFAMTSFAMMPRMCRPHPFSRPGDASPPAVAEIAA